MTIYEFFFQSFWHWLGATIWLLVIIGFIQKRIFPRVVTGWDRFRELFKRNLQKELKVKP